MRSQTLVAVATRCAEIADELRADAAHLADVVGDVGPARARSPGELVLVARWLALEGRALKAIGPLGAWGSALELDALAAGLRAAAAAYAQVERAVEGLLAGVAGAADLAGRAGWFADAAPATGGGTAPHAPSVSWVASTLTGPLAGRGGSPGRVASVADLVEAGQGLDGGRVRVVETVRGDGGSAWVVIVPGTQEWSPRAGVNPFDLTTDVRALTGDTTLAAAGVSVALAQARARSGRATPGDPVLLVGHSQGGILAAALASDPAFRRRQNLTHVVTSGAPVGLFPVPSSTRVLSIEHADDPVPRLDLTPNPAGDSWTTIVAPAAASAPFDVDRHRLAAYVDTVRVAQGAPRGTVPGLGGWQASAGAFLEAPVRSVSDAVIRRPPAAPGPE